MKHMTSKLLKKTTLSAAVALSLGATVAPNSAEAQLLEFNVQGLFTMLTGGGAITANTVTNYWYNSAGTAYYNNGNRTNITGTLTYCVNNTTGCGSLAVGEGTLTIDPFLFFGTDTKSLAKATGITFQTIGDGAGGPGTLAMGNMSFEWNGNVGIPVPIVWDMAGLLGYINAGTYVAGNTVNYLSPGSVAPASEHSLDVTNKTGTTHSQHVGPVPVATTTWNLTPTITCSPGGGATGPCMGINPSGTLPLLATYPVGYWSGFGGETSPIGGNPMLAGPFEGFNANFDFTRLQYCPSGICGLPTATVSPLNGAANVDTLATVQVTENNKIDAATFAAPGVFTLVETATTTPVAGTVAPSSGTTGFTSTFTPTSPLKYSTQYTATLTTAAKDAAGSSLSSNLSWSFTTRAQPLDGCATPSAVVPLGSNFTMLNPEGKPFGGTNDIEYNFGNGLNNGYNATLLNNSVNGTLGITTNIMRSVKPQPFFGFVWTAHHIRLFSPGTYIINTDCTAAELKAGTCAPNSVASKNLTMYVPSGHVGAHMLFNWNTSSNIDVVNVWSPNAAWNTAPLGLKNQPWTGDLWAGPAGVTVDPDTVYALASTDDSDVNGINGVGMIDGPFQNYSANFNLSPASSCVATTSTINMNVSSEPKGSGGCSLVSGKSVSLAERGDWWLVAGFLAWLGLVRKRFTRQRN